MRRLRSRQVQRYHTKVRAQSAGQFDEHAWQDTFVNGFLQELPGSGRAAYGSAPGRPASDAMKSHESREHDLERRNLEADDVAIHDGIFLSNQWLPYIEIAVSMTLENYQRLNCGGKSTCECGESEGRRKNGERGLFCWQIVSAN